MESAKIKKLQNATFWAIFKQCGEARKSDSLGITDSSLLFLAFLGDRWQNSICRRASLFLRSQSNAIPIGLSRGFVCSLNQIPKGRFREAAASLDPLNLTRTKAQGTKAHKQNCKNQDTSKTWQPGINCFPSFTTVFENHQKMSHFQYCERSELRLHFEWTKVN